LTKILADDLEDDQFLQLVDFLRSVSGTKFVRRGKKIEIIGATNKKVKFLLLRKFLHANRLSEYHVLDTTAALEIVRIKPEEGKKKTKKPALLKHPVPYGPAIPCAIRPELGVEWQGKPPPKKTRRREGH
jgi:hypothetical protein